MNRIYVCFVVDVSEGEVFWIDISFVIVLFNVGGEFYVINDCCSYGNVSMLEGYLEDDVMVECLLYVVSFCLKMGKVLCLFVIDLFIIYLVYVEGGDIFIDLLEV